MRTVVANHELLPKRLELEWFSIEPGRVTSPPRRPADEVCAFERGVRQGWGSETQVNEASCSGS